ncbi:MAG: tRNA (guanosine(37)-N1)-methyltransferase TrmD [Desulfovibrionaceae bacterium]|nr:tRNA (guanosine(37)-N1)-methyltransferase TrmD [Desulfovibrionaceae bacterium]
MNIHIVTLFPEFFESPLRCGLLGKAVEDGIIRVHLHNPRKFTSDLHQSVDDRPYGGGPGMVMLLDPLVQTLEEIAGETDGKGKTLLMAASGARFDQTMARSLAEEKNITIICGRYEGIDARLGELFPLRPISIGAYVLNGGETAALGVLEAVSRLVPGFMGREESGDDESYSHGLLEYPHYTRPPEYRGIKVPEALTSGNHAMIARWRRAKALEATWKMQPEMLRENFFDAQDIFILRQLPRKRLGRSLFVALVHYPVLDREKKSVAVSLTNLDIHDIARCSCSYGMGGAFIVTPLNDQKRLLGEIIAHWTSGAGGRTNPHRAMAFESIFPADSVEDAVAQITRQCGQEPYLLASSAQGPGNVSFREVRGILEQRPVLLLLGTSQGLSPLVLKQCQGMLPPLRYLDSYNHLSVRMAGAIIIDRILGDLD